MRKDFFPFFDKKRRKQCANFILCCSFASVLAFTQSFPALAASSETTKISDITTVSSSDKKETASTSKSAKTKEVIEEETSTVADSSTDSDEASSKDASSSSDKKSEASDKKTSSKENSDEKASSKKESSKDEASDEEKDTSDKTSDKEKKEASDDSDDEDVDDSDQESKENSKSKDSSDEKDSASDSDEEASDEEASDEKDSSSSDDSDSEEEKASSSDEYKASDKKADSDSEDTAASTDDSTASSEESSSEDSEKASSTTSIVDSTTYDTVEDIEIATEDPSEYDDNELLVQFKTDVSEEMVEQIESELPNTTLKSYSDGIAVFTAKTKTVIEEDIALLSTVENISIIQPNYKYTFSSVSADEKDSDSDNDDDSSNDSDSSSSDDSDSSSDSDSSDVSSSSDEDSDASDVSDSSDDTDSSSDDSDASEDMDDEDDNTYSFPNDTFFLKQWGLYNQSTSGASVITSSLSKTTGIDIDVLGAWKNLQSDNEVIVAVIDTGVDYQHKDLKDHMWYNKAELDGTKGTDDDNNGYEDDIYGWDFYNDDATVCHYSGTTANKKDNDNHGTECAGIIAATANNNFGIAGVASNVNVKIMSLKTAGGANAESDTATIIQAIKYASYNGAKICNASWNCDSDDPALKLAIAESNMLFICSAGNGYGTNIDDEPSYPCSYDLSNIVGVTSIDSDGTLSYFSNVGKKSVDLAAPGSSICSTIVGKYAYDSGTSMATPFVTGVAAMLYAYDASLYPARAKALLLESTTTLSTLTDQVSTGGIIDAAAAVSNLEDKQYKEDTTPPVITASVAPRKNGAYLKVKVTDKGGSKIRVKRYAFGKHTASYFKNGENGKVLSAGTKPFVTKTGSYTIYAQDNAGNETVEVVNVTFDTTKPSLSLSAKKSGQKYKLTITASDSGAGIKEVRYAKGKHTASYFKSSGKILQAFEDTKTVTLSSKEIYSVYVKDRAGNYTIKTITLDKTAPSLSLSYKRSSRKYNITLKASDSGSGLSEVRYVRGNHNASYIKSHGKKLSSFKKSKVLTAYSKGTYSFLAKDKAGNTVVKKIKIK